MSELDWYRASDRRVYEGALCSDMKRERDSIDRLKKMLPENSLCTYFPLEGKWDCSLKDFKGQMFYQVGWQYELGDCLVEALNNIKKLEAECVTTISV